MNKMRQLTARWLGIAVVVTAGAAQAATYNFTSGEGFTNGVLDGQNGWTGNNTVDVSGTGSAVLSTNQWQGSTASADPLSTNDNVFTVSGVFSFTEAVTNGGNDVIGFSLAGENGGAFRAALQRSQVNDNGGGTNDLTSTKYSMVMKGLNNASYGWMTFSDTDLGVDDTGTDYDTDRLQLTMTLGRGADTNDWDYSLILSNLTAGTQISTASGAGAVSDTNMYNSANLYGSFTSSRSEAQTGTTNRKVDSFSVSSIYVAPPAAPSPTIVKWGAAGGENVVDANVNFAIKDTTYTAGHVSLPSSAAYYPDGTNSLGEARSTDFNHVASVNSNTKRVTNSGSADYISSAKNQKEYRTLVVWENFLTNNTALKTLATELGVNNSVTASEFRWVIEKGTGLWFASDPTPTTASIQPYSTADASSLTWYAFNPGQDLDAVTFATNSSSVVMDDISSVGVYCYFTNTAANYREHRIRYFEATAEPGSTSEALVQWGDAGGDTNMLANGSTNVLKKSNGSFWTTYEEGITNCPGGNADYYTNPTGHSPLFNCAVGAGFNGASINTNDLDGGDYMAFGKNQGNYQAMVTWDQFLAPPSEVQTLSAEIRYQNHATNGVVRFLIKNATSGNWYASEAITINSGWTAPIVDAANVTWYDFTPMINGSASNGAVASVDLTDVAAVGFHAEIDGDGAYQAIQVRNFTVAGVADTGLNAYETWALNSGVTGTMADDDDGDALSNWGEYIFGGDPVPPNGHLDQGAQPTFGSSAGEYIYVLRNDNSLTARVLTRPNLIIGDWTTNAPMAVSVNDGGFTSYTNTTGTAAPEQFIKLLVQ